MDRISRTEIISALCILLIATVMRADDCSLTPALGVFQKAHSEASYFFNPTQPSPFLLCNRPVRGFPRIALAFQHSESNRTADRGAPGADEGVPIPLDAEEQTDTDKEVSSDLPPDEAEVERLTLFGDAWHEAGSVTGEFFVYFQQNHGRTLTRQFLGDGQYCSSIDTALDQDITQLFHQSPEGFQLLYNRIPFQMYATHGRQNYDISEIYAGSVSKSPHLWQMFTVEESNAFI